jgi:hypothetical protein
VSHHAWPIFVFLKNIFLTLIDTSNYTYL